MRTVHSTAKFKLNTHFRPFLPWNHIHKWHYNILCGLSEMLLYVLRWLVWPNLIPANISPSCLSAQSFCHSVNEVVWQSGAIKSRAGVAVPTQDPKLPYLLKRQRFSFIELRIPLTVKAVSEASLHIPPVTVLRS